VWKTHFGRSCGPVIRQAVKLVNKLIIICIAQWQVVLLQCYVVVIHLFFFESQFELL
jgi:hypothetical protein